MIKKLTTVNIINFTCLKWKGIMKARLIGTTHCLHICLLLLLTGCSASLHGDKLTFKPDRNYLERKALRVMYCIALYCSGLAWRLVSISGDVCLEVKFYKPNNYDFHINLKQFSRRKYSCLLANPNIKVAQVHTSTSRKFGSKLGASVSAMSVTRIWNITLQHNATQ